MIIGFFDLLKAHGAAFVDCCFGDIPDVLSKVGDRIISLSIHIVIEELVPSL